MSLLFNPFNRPSQAGGAAWFHAGPTSSFPNITDAHRVAEQRLCNDKHLPGCKVFHVPRQDSSLATQVAIDEWKDPEAGGNAKDQVMVFQYKGRFVAVDHECPHSSYPLSNGTPFDIEDFGVTLSSGLVCPKHEWAFDLFTGRADRGGYKLRVWEVQLRPVGDGPGGGGEGEGEAGEMDVWVRRKQRIG